ncbi:MAG: dihydropteroate synthase [Bacilli bacterium]
MNEMNNSTTFKQLLAQKKPIVMGILNTTPDSFSDGGAFCEVDVAVQRALTMIEEGADIVDIGGESTRPGAAFVNAQTEISRVVPVIEGIRKAHSSILISVDTYKVEVAEAAIHAGANIINDVWGGLRDEFVLRYVAKAGVPYVMMHNREDKNYHHFSTDFLQDISNQIQRAQAFGVATDQIIIDPGIGFAKSYEQNFQAMRCLHALSELSYPVLLGTSRKSFIGITLETEADQRLEGSLATVGYGIERGVSIFRVHDVQATKRFLTMYEKLLNE